MGSGITALGSGFLRNQGSDCTILVGLGTKTKCQPFGIKVEKYGCNNGIGDETPYLAATLKF